MRDVKLLVDPRRVRDVPARAPSEDPAPTYESVASSFLARARLSRAAVARRDTARPPGGGASRATNAIETVSVDGRREPLPTWTAGAPPVSRPPRTSARCDGQAEARGQRPAPRYPHRKAGWRRDGPLRPWPPSAGGGASAVAPRSSQNGARPAAWAGRPSVHSASKTPAKIAVRNTLVTIGGRYFVSCPPPPASHARAKNAQQKRKRRFPTRDRSTLTGG